MLVKGELRSILTLSSFIHLECCQYRQKTTKIGVDKKTSLLSSF